MPRLPQIRHQVMLATRHKIHGLHDGIHTSLNAGRSVDFHDIRSYIRGDDTADIDWNASARSGSLLVRRHVAQRRASVIVALPTGTQLQSHASVADTRSEICLDVAATFAAVALEGGDYTALLWWNHGAKIARPSTRAVLIEQMLTDAQAALSAGSSPGVGELAEAAARAARRPSVVVLVCGDEEIDHDLHARLRRLSYRHDVLLVVVPDLDPTSALDYPVVGLESGAPLSVELRSDPLLHDAVAKDRRQRANRREAALAGLGIGHTVVTQRTEVVARVLHLIRRMRHAR